MQLDSKLVDVELITLSAGGAGFELNRDDFTKGLTIGSSEGQVDGVDLVVIRLNMGKDIQGDGDFDRLLTLDLLLNWYVDFLDGCFLEVLLIGKGESAPLFPGPEGIVKHFDLFVESDTRADA